MSYKMSGNIIHKGDMQILGEKKFNKIEIVIECEGEYPQTIKFEVLGNTAKKANTELKEGLAIEVLFDVRGNEYKGKYYTNLVMYGWDVIGSVEEEHEEEEEQETRLPF